MKSISADLVNEFIVLLKNNNITFEDHYTTPNKLSNIDDDGYGGSELEDYYFKILTKAKQHALTCQTILENRWCSATREAIQIYDYCESEIKILKEGGLI